MTHSNYTPPPQGWEPPRKKRWPLVLGIVTLGSAILIGVFANYSTPDTTTRVVAPTGPDAIAPLSTTVEVAAPDESIPGDGTYEVGPGKDMEPGKYKTAGPSGSSCYWARKNPSADDPVEGIIQNGNSDGQVIVTVKQNELFETAGCERWVRQ